MYEEVSALWGRSRRSLEQESSPLSFMKSSSPLSTPGQDQ